VGCVDLLIATDRIPEAAFFARTYAPSQASRVVKLWKADLEAKKKQKIAVGIADPETDPDLFGESWEEALQLEKGGVQDYVPAGQQEDLLQMDEEDAADMVEKLKINDEEPELDGEDDEDEFAEPEVEPEVDQFSAEEAEEDDGLPVSSIDRSHQPSTMTDVEEDLLA
jgi:coatomer subunit beta'